MNLPLPQRGDAFTLSTWDKFGVVLSTNVVRGICYVELQNRERGEIPIALVATLFTSLYPRVMVSSSDFQNSLTVDDAALKPADRRAVRRSAR